MNSIKKMLIAGSFVVLVSTFAHSVQAFGMDESNWPTRITFTEPLQVGDLSLTPGTYEFYVAPSTVTRNVVMVYDVDKGRWAGMTIGIYVSRRDTAETRGFALQERGNGAPDRLEYWFYPGWNRGLKFLYHQTNVAGNMSASVSTGR